VGVQTESPSVSPEPPVRLGCGQYCLTAGGYGADNSEVRDPVKMTVDDPVVPFEDGTIPVWFTCLTKLDCEGAVIVDFSNSDDVDRYGSPEYGSADGRCDLLIEAGRSEAFAVPLSQPILAALNDAARVHVLVTADALPTLERLPSSERRKYSGIALLEIVVIAR
jgi:hypothetical protein